MNFYRPQLQCNSNIVINKELISSQRDQKKSAAIEKYSMPEYETVQQLRVTVEEERAWFTEYMTTT